MWGRKQRLEWNRRVRRRRWQKTVIAKANLLEHEGKLLYRQDQLRDQQDQRGDQQEQLPISDGSQEAIRDVVLTAVKKQLDKARMAAGDEGEAGEGGNDSKGQQSSRPRRRLLPAGAECEEAFASLHAAQVTVVNLYSEEDITAKIPALLERLQKCLPATDQRLLKAKAALDPAVTSTGDRLAGNHRGNGRSNIRQLILLEATNPPRQLGSDPGRP
jgi:hypothetical protein